MLSGVPRAGCAEGSARLRAARAVSRATARGAAGPQDGSRATPSPATTLVRTPHDCRRAPGAVRWALGRAPHGWCAAVCSPVCLRHATAIPRWLIWRALVKRRVWAHTGGREHPYRRDAILPPHGPAPKCLVLPWTHLCVCCASYRNSIATPRQTRIRRSELCVVYGLVAA